MSEVLAQCALTLLMISLASIATYVSICLYKYYLTFKFFPDDGKIFLDGGVVGLFAALVLYLVSLVPSVWGR